MNKPMIDKALGFIFAITCSIIVTAINAAGQAKPAGQKEVLRLKTDLIQLQVVVTDKQGRVIEDLKKEDFELLEQGRPQEVSFFSLERFAARDEKIAPDNSPIKDQNARRPVNPSRAEKQSRSVALFVDTFHLSAPNLLRVKQALKQFVDEQLTDQDTVLLATTTGTFGIFGQSTQDRQALALLVGRLTPFQGSSESYFTPYLAAMVRRGDPDALRVAGQVMQAEEGLQPMATDWQPVASHLIGADKKGLEIGGRLMLTLPAGLYELRLSIRNDKSGQTAQRMVAFGIDSMSH